jgi:hypothetical protein
MNAKEPYGTKHCLNWSRTQCFSEKSSIKFCKSVHFCSGGWQLVLFTFYKNLVISEKCWEKCFELTSDKSVKRLTRNCVYSAGVGLVQVSNNWDFLPPTIHPFKFIGLYAKISIPKRHLSKFAYTNSKLTYTWRSLYKFTNIMPNGQTLPHINLWKVTFQYWTWIWHLLLEFSGKRKGWLTNLDHQLHTITWWCTYTNYYISVLSTDEEIKHSLSLSLSLSPLIDMFLDKFLKKLG